MNITEEQVQDLLGEYIRFGLCPEMTQPAPRSKDFFSHGIIYELWQQLAGLPLNISWIPRKEEMTNLQTKKSISVRDVVFNILRKAEENADLFGRAMVTSVDIAQAMKELRSELLGR